MSPELASDLSSEETIQRMKAWYQKCLNCHEKCSWRLKGADEFQLPTRLIDVGQPGSKTCRLRLTSSESLDSISEGYLTLSHRWGQAKFLELNSSNIDALRAGILISELPRCFRDAVLLAHTFSIHYLWIDSLCIRQDLKEDWLKEAPNMQKIYGFATINIVAGHSLGPEYSMFDTQDRFSAQSMIVRAEWDNKQPTNYLLWNDTTTKEDFERAPLTRRGWVFQERLLAPRVLQFGKAQVYWRCLGLFASESCPQGVYSAEGKETRYDFDLDQLKLVAAGIYQLSDLEDQSEMWQYIVINYSRCELTFPQDKLIALSGVARLFQQVTADRYLAGIWRSSIFRYLRWRRTSFNGHIAKPRPAYRAPTWSWASIDGPVTFARYDGPWQRACWTKSLVDILDANVTPLHGDSIAQVKDGYITAKGKLHSFTLISKEKEKFVYKIDGEIITGDKTTFTADIALERCEQLELWVLPIVVMALSGFIVDLYVLEGMVLVESNDLNVTIGGNKIYRRVGWFKSNKYFREIRDETFGLHIYKESSDYSDDESQDDELDTSSGVASDGNGSGEQKCDENKSDENSSGQNEDESDSCESDWDYEEDTLIDGSFRFRRRAGAWYTIKIM